MKTKHPDTTSSNSPLTGLRGSLADPGEFTLTFELVPGRGGRSRELRRIVELARAITGSGRFQALSITENAGGHPALAPEVLGAEIRAMGLDVIIHLSCKDKNRNQMESLLHGWNRLDLHNLLVIAGDYPREGYRGAPKPVFDLDTVQALDMLGVMNRGDTVSPRPERGLRDPHPTAFFKGVAVSPFKHLEAELVTQYYKLHRKVAAGADFVITQVGYSARKFHELLQYMRQNGLRVPVLGNVFIPSLAVAEHMYRGRIPGCVLTGELYRLIMNEAGTEDRGKRRRLERGAALLAVLKGLGYDGAHIGGPGLTMVDLEYLLDRFAAMEANWREYVPELSFWPESDFYFFKKDEESGLNLPDRSEPARPARGGPAYALARISHEQLFRPGGLFFKPMKKGCLLLAARRLAGPLGKFEHLLKLILFNCRNCGDCTLADLAFFCPQSGCAKYLLNGPCGGSIDGWCEVYPGRRRCVYVRIYERLRSLGREEEMKTGFVPPRDWHLNRTSSWINYFLGLDHTGGPGGTGGR